MDNQIPVNTVTISKQEYEDLIYSQRVLSALEAGGVDNWEWYEEALEGLEDD